VSFTISQPTNVTFNWITQYYLTVKRSPPVPPPIAGEGWYDEGVAVTLTAPLGTTEDPFRRWDVDGASQGNLVNPITVTMDAAHTATAHYYVPGVGGEWAPVNVVQVAAPYIALAFLAVAALAAGSWRLFRKRW
jgi:hypothetical protein